MHRAMTFFFMAAGVFLLAVSFNLGARSAGAQAGSTVSGFATGGSPYGGVSYFVLTPNGDVYRSDADRFDKLVSVGKLIGNLWGGPTPAQVESWGAVKSRYRPQQAEPTPTNR